MSRGWEELSEAPHCGGCQEPTGSPDKDTTAAVQAADPGWALTMWLLGCWALSFFLSVAMSLYSPGSDWFLSISALWCHGAWALEVNFNIFFCFKKRSCCLTPTSSFENTVAVCLRRMQLTEVCLPRASLARCIHSLPLEARLLTQFTLTPIFWCYYFPFLTFSPPSGLNTVFPAPNFAAFLDCSCSPVLLPLAVNSHFHPLAQLLWSLVQGTCLNLPYGIQPPLSSWEICHLTVIRKRASATAFTTLMAAVCLWQKKKKKKKTNWARLLQATKMGFFGFCTFVLPSGITVLYGFPCCFL